MLRAVVQCRVLGGAEIYTDAARLTPESELQFGLTLYLCANAGRGLLRDEVARIFWPEQPSEPARHCLRQALYRLRTLGVPVRGGARLAMLDEQHVEADYAPLIADGAPPGAFAQLRDVSVLPGYSPGFSRLFAEWIEVFRGEVAGGVRRGLVRAIADARARGRYSLVEELARRCLALDPLNEEATLALAEATALAGSKLEAVRMIERYMDEIGPGQGELRLAPALLRRRVSEVLVERRQSQGVGELPLIGRDDDVERVVLCMGAALRGDSTAYAVTGESGIGKTRLALHCSRIGQLHGAQVVQLEAVPANRGQPLAVLCRLIAAMLELPGSLGCAPAALECLRALIGASPDSEAAAQPAVDAESRLAVLRWSLIDLADALLGEAALFLFLDDLQYADPASIRLLRDLIHACNGKRLFVLFCIRSDLPESRNQALLELLSLSRQHQLRPLAVEARRALTRVFASAAGESFGEDAVERAVQLSGGNPFFLVEILKHLLDRRELPELPLTLRSLVEQRLARLSENTLRLLQVSALLGRLATPSRLRRLLRVSQVDLMQQIGELERAGIACLVGNAVLCGHELICILALAMLTEAQLQLLHRRVAALLTRELLRSHAVADLWTCIEHWQRAGRPDLALRLALRVAHRLTQSGLASEAMEVLQSLQASLATVEERAAWLQELIGLAAAQRDWKEVLARCREYKEVASQLSQPQATHSDIELHECDAILRLDDSIGSLPPYLYDCVSAVEASSRHRLEAALLLLIKADNDGDEGTATKVIRLVSTVPIEASTRAVAQACRLIYETIFGVPSRAVRLADRLVAHASTTSDVFLRLRSLRYAAAAHRVVGDLEYARTLASEALGIARKFGLSSHEHLCLELLALISLELGHHDLAASLTAELRKHAEQRSGLFFQAVAYVLESRLAFELNDPTMLAPRHLRAYMLETLPRLRTLRPHEATLAALLAQSLIAQSEEVRGEQIALLHECYTVLRRYGNQDFPAAVLAQAYLQAGDIESARSLLVDYKRCRRESPQSHPYLPSLRRAAGLLGLEMQ
jgi:hypothetical protein